MFSRKTALLWAALSPAVAWGAGNPILVVGGSSNAFSFYTAEILRAEGVNSFDTADIASVSAATLSAYDLVILGNVPLSAAQTSMFSTWVNGGGNLVAFRPDKQLASLFGVADAGATLSNAYLLVNTAAAPGAGIVSQTIQFHGTADLYSLGGAAAVATLYNTAQSSAGFPAVTLRTGIGSGGKAAAFTYDLARSVVYTRQGNPAWAGQSRVNQGGPIRSSDLFFGAASFDPQPDWVDLSKVAIPQADEQQRLLVNLILTMNQGKRPLPRFWYFPFGKKAAVIMTGDDHANGATLPRFDDYLAASPAGCSVANWECVRGTSYIYHNTPITNAQAVNYESQGFEVALHINTGCADYTAASLPTIFASELGLFAARYPGVPSPSTNRTHCIAWSDWSTQAEVSLTRGIRLDTNYYYWPPSWVVPTPGFMTGSGIPMRFARTDGGTIDVYQAATQMTDESGQAYPDTINGLLDNAIGPAGYYGAFTANIHTDSNTGSSKVWSDQIVASALSRGVPVITARQMLTWLDGRDTSRFVDPTWVGNTLTFTITAGSGANGLQAMLPTSGPSGVLTGLTRSGQPVGYTLQVVKGVQYAFFSAAAGAYVATYSGAAPPAISAVSANPGTTTATVTWTTDRPANSRVDYGTTPALGSSASNAPLATSHSIVLSGLATGTTYYYRVTSIDGAGGTATAPLTGEPPATFTTVDPNPPVISAVNAVSGFGGTAYVSWTTNKLANSRVDYGTSPSALTLNVTSSALTTGHNLPLSGLTLGATYHYRVTSTDALGNTTSFPVTGNPPLSFVVTTAATIWPITAVPLTLENSDPASVEVGLRFRSDLAGVISGVRFYKGPNNGGTHVGKLWTNSGTLLGSVTFTGESASGWQQANFTNPIAIAANTTYVVSYHAPNGRYSTTANAFAATGVNNPPLRALADGADGPNGVYLYGAGGFPNQSFQSTNYWVDVVFNDTVAPSISNVTATPSPASAVIAWTTSEPASSRVDYGTSPGSLSQSVSAGGLVTSHSLTLPGLTTGTTYYYRVTSVDGSGNSASAPASPGSFVPADVTPPAISALGANPGTTSATITWSTDEPATARVDYGLSPSALSLQVSRASLATNHSLTLTGLQVGAVYYYRVTSADAAGNSSVAPAAGNPPNSFTTIDPNPPVISAVAVAAELGGVSRVTWTTNKLATSRVDYGTSAASLNLNVSASTLTAAHALSLTGLSAGTTYFYRVTSVDSLGNATTFPAPPAAPLSFVASTAVTIWPPATVPATADSGDTSAVELGLKFRSDTGGIVSAVRFYKSAANTGTHVGKLWTGSGTLLGSVTFTSETASGWQQANFATPIAIAANATYIVSYHAPNGRYAIQAGAFIAAGVANPPLRALVDGVDGGNGVYLYGAGGFPNQTFNASNYWVDVVFTDNAPPVILAPLVTSAGATATVSWTTNEPSTSRVDYGLSASALTSNVSSPALVTSHGRDLTGLTPGATYFYRVTSVDALGHSSTWPPLADPPASFVASVTRTIWPVSATPAVLAESDAAAVELGLKFQSDSAGSVLGVRFYKGDGNSGTHVGKLWNSSGALLGSVTFTNESPSGWQQANFATPIAIAANTTYVVSYHAPQGRYSVNSGAFAAAGVTNLPLRALANGADGPNGVYLYGAGGFPNQSFQSSNYWVDVVFVDTIAPAISSVNAVTAATSATITWSTDEPATSRVDYGTSPTALNVSATGTTPVTSHSLTLNGLSTGATYYFRVSSADASGNSTTSPAPPSQPGTFVPAAAPSPLITARTATPGSTSAIVTWTTDLASNSRVDYGTSPTNLDLSATDGTQVTAHSVVLSSLTASTVYYYRVTSTTAAGGSSVSPAAGTPAATFTTSAAGGGDPGNPPSEWEVSGAGDPSIQGFATDISVNKGQTVSFKISTNSSAYTIDIYRLGYYNGNGAKKVATITPSAALPQSQPACLTTPSTGLIDCGNWAVSASWAVPADAKSGVYFARPRRNDTGGASHIMFVVRDDASTSAILFQTADTTWQAYNQYGGNSLYTGSPAGRAYKVSYNRPFTTRAYAPEDWVFNSEYPMIRWLEANGYDVTYTTGVDSDRRGNLIRNHRLFLSVGHDEYWSGVQRTNVETARDSGVHLAFFSGNEVFWKTRWENSHRTLVCYKETHANAKIDPSPEWTGTWRDARFSPPSDGGRPENGLTGTIFTVNCCDSGTSVQVPAADGKMRFWRNTNLQGLAPGTSATLTSDTLSYEWDEDLDNGSRPAGLIWLSTSQYAVGSKLQDNGSTYASGSATHHTTLYRAPSGAWVFGAGTVQWTWGLDANHDRGNPPADSRMQQGVVNLFADMGIQPATLQPGLVPATASADAIRPASAITFPAAGATLPVNAPVTITGTASDLGGGAVGAVEVSTDGGVRWRPATGRDSWSFSWTPVVTGAATILVRAIDDSLNMQNPATSISVTVATGGGGGSAQSIWLPTATPATVDSGDASAVELGMKFRSDIAGQITGVRFYKAAANTGTHAGKLWTASGTLLGTVTFTGETASGWQQANFSTPINIAANTTYIVSYYAPAGRYSINSGFFVSSGVDTPPLHALPDGVDGPNGIYRYGAGGGFPSNTWQSSNYWVDVVFRPLP